MKLIEVSPISSKVAKDSLTYFSSKAVHVGDIVSVEVRKKKYDALVVGVSDVRSAKGDLKSSNIGFKKIDAVRGRAPFYPEFFTACGVARDYFAGNLGQIIDYFIPTEFLEQYETLPTPKSRIQNGKSIFRVCATVREAEKLYELLKSNRSNVFLIHGSLRKKTLLERYSEILECEEPVTVVMTPSFLFLPRHDVGSIIIENDIGGHWNTIKRPYFDLRIFAKFLAGKLGAEISYGSGLVSVETYFETKKLPAFSFGGPTSKIVDMSNKENLFKKSFILSNDAQETLKKRGHTFLFSLRKGLATQIICHDCKHVLEHDGEPLTLHEKDGKRIFRSAYTRKIIEDTKVRCPNCGSWNFDSLGIGTGTVTDEVKKFFPKRKVFQIDADTTSSPRKIKEVLTNFYAESDAVLVSTEIALPYIEHVNNSVIISVDSLLHIPSYKIYEKILSLVVNISSVTKDNFIIQTRSTENAVIESIEQKDLKIFYEKDSEKRKLFKYPPFSTVIKLSRISNKDDFHSVMAPVIEYLAKWSPATRRISRGRVFETSILLKLPKEAWGETHQDPRLSSILSSLGPDWQIRINPENLF